MPYDLCNPMDEGKPKSTLLVSPEELPLQLTAIHQLAFIATATLSSQAHQAAQASPDLGHTSTPDPTQLAPHA